MFIVGGATTTATNKCCAGNDLLDDDEDSVALFILTTQSYLEGMNGEAFHVAQEEIPNSNEQPSQEQHTANFNTTTVEANQTNLITRAVKDLEINPEGGTNTEVPNA